MPKVRNIDRASMTTDKWLATRNFINLWLADETLYCNNCGMDFDVRFFKESPCCENPQIGRNFDHMYGLYQQNRLRRESLKNEYGASSKKKQFRVCISLPPRLLANLEEFFKKHGEKLFNDYDELVQFMNRFPEFKVPERT